MKKHLIIAGLSCLLGSLWGVLGCAPPPSRVPALTADDLPRVKWPHVQPRSTLLTVHDERQIPIKESDAAVESARSALTGALTKSQVTVSDDSPNRLELTLDYADERPVGDSLSADCIKATLRLKFSLGKVETWGVGCYQTRDIALGPGEDATDALDDALTGALEGLDEQLRKYKDRDGDGK